MFLEVNCLVIDVSFRSKLLIVIDVGFRSEISAIDFSFTAILTEKVSSDLWIL